VVSIMLTSIDKIEITFRELNPHLEKDLHFEKGKNNVKTIKINDESRFIEIEYEDDNKWDGKLIPFSTVKTISYKTNKIKSLLLGNIDHS
jgi:hypothetical protein